MNLPVAVYHCERGCRFFVLALVCVVLVFGICTRGIADFEETEWLQTEDISDGLPAERLPERELFVNLSKESRNKRSLPTMPYDVKAYIGSAVYIIDSLGVPGSELYDRLPTLIINGLNYAGFSSSDIGVDLIKMKEGPFKGYTAAAINPVTPKFNNYVISFFYYVFNQEHRRYYDIETPKATLIVAQIFPVNLHPDLECTNSRITIDNDLSPELLSYLATSAGEIKPMDITIGSDRFTEGVYLDSETSLSPLYSAELRNGTSRHLLILVNGGKGNIAKTETITAEEGLEFSMVGINIANISELINKHRFENLGSGIGSEAVMASSDLNSDSLSQYLSVESKEVVIVAEGTGFEGRGVFECNLGGKCFFYGVELTVGESVRDAPPESILIGRRGKGFVYNVVFKPIDSVLAAKGDRLSIIYNNCEIYGRMLNTCRLYCPKVSCHGFKSCFPGTVGCLAQTDGSSTSCLELPATDPLAGKSTFTDQDAGPLPREGQLNPRNYSSSYFPLKYSGLSIAAAMILFRVLSD